MKCPVCKDVTLLMSEKNWIEIDYCPECRWVWLDRWELEKLMNVEKEYYSNENFDFKNYNQNNHQNNNYPQQHNNHHGHHKKKSIFEALDFFD